MGSNPTSSILNYSMVFLIKVSSKNKETLQLFLMFLSKLENNNLLIKYFPKQKIKKFVTILKSPHVNKSAQEQFEFRVYTKKLRISSLHHLKFLYFLKKSQITLFPFINLKIEGNYSIKSQLNLISVKFDPKKFNNKFFSQNKFKKELKNPDYVNVMKVALKNSDAVIVGSEDIPAELEDYINTLGKPVLKYLNKEDIEQGYLDFYKSQVLEEA